MSGQQPLDASDPGLYGDAFGTPIGACGICIDDPVFPGGPDCVFSEWDSNPPASMPTAPRLQVLKFQPTPGTTLVQAEFRIRAEVCAALRVENRDPMNMCFVSLSLGPFFLSVMPAAGQGIDFLATAIPAPTIGLFSSPPPIVLGPFDGTSDFAGESGVSVSVGPIAGEVCIRITDPAQLAAFVDTGIGSSFLFFDHTAAEQSSASGCAPQTFESDPFAGVEMQVTYTTCSVGNPPTCDGSDQVDGSVGEELTWSWVGSDPDGDPLTFSVSGLPAGAVVTPDPLGGPYPQPLDVSVTWTPAASQVGSTDVCVTFTDAQNQSSSCCTSVDVSECHLIIADGPGGDIVTIGGHAYPTQVQGVQQTWPVLVDMMPSFSVTIPPRLAQAQGTNAAPLLTAIVPLRQFAAQVVMFNPDQFPSNPEQFTSGLAVIEWSDGRVTAQPYGVADGMILTLDTYIDESGKRFYRFPFSILGL